jgi:DNA mismatch repair protein MutL
LARPLGTALGLIGSRYLIADTRKGLAIIDVHAAHERIIHERLKNRSAATNVDRRPISPVAVRLNALDTARVLDRREDLLRAGLDVDEAPDHEGVIVSGMPASLPGVDAISLVRAVASELAHDPLSDPLGSRLDRLSRTIACHAAFRTGDEITLERLDLMLREIEATPNAARCNHGRPTTISLTLDDLDRLFERS